MLKHGTTQKEQAESVVVRWAPPEARKMSMLAQWDLSEDVHVTRTGSGKCPVLVVEEPRQKRARTSPSKDDKKEKEEEEEKEEEGCNLLDGAYDSD